MRQRTTITFDEDTLKRLKYMAADHNTKVNTIVEEAVKQYLIDNNYQYKEE